MLVGLLVKGKTIKKNGKMCKKRPPGAEASGGEIFLKFCILFPKIGIIAHVREAINVPARYDRVPFGAAPA